MQFLKKIFLSLNNIIKYINEHFKGFLFLLLLVLLFLPSSDENLHKHNLEKITLNGAIFDVNDLVQQIDKVEKNKYVKGVLFVVDSPGGAVAPSIELSYAIKRLREKKPVVVYAKGTIASGSYYASIWANKIVANPGSMVGSIGVIMQGANLKPLMDKIGIKTQVVKAGKYKQVGTPDREWTPYEKRELEKIIQDTYNMFTNDVAKARGLKINKRNTWANAHIFTASQAKKVGLIDIVGVEYEAKLILKTLANVQKPVWNKESEVDKFLKKISASTLSLLNTYFPTLVIK
jgi:protease-4